MQIVIKIDKGIAHHIIYGRNDVPRNTVRSFQATIADAIKNGVILPEGHGDLIDISNIDVIELEDSTHIIKHEKGDEVDVYISAPIIIEADRSEK